MIIRQATVSDLDSLIPLFDAYRQFYQQPSDPAGARTFLSDRFVHQQSVILIAWEGNRAQGFTQLYPSFSSTRMARTFILNDLFVSPDARGAGIGKALLSAACDYGKRAGAVRLALSTAVDNANAQALYEHAGWTRDTQFYAYNIALD